MKLVDVLKPVEGVKVKKPGEEEKFWPIRFLRAEIWFQRHAFLSPGESTACTFMFLKNRLCLPESYADKTEEK